MRHFWGPSVQTGADPLSWPERPFDWAHDFALTSARSEDERNDDGMGHYPDAQEALALVHDVFGNPFHPVAFDPAWRTSTAVALAAQMYESRDFSVMPILADALQDAGCDNEDVLTHCRDAALEHVRGCWVVDEVLARV
jgi:hypothetical protein